MCWVSMGKAVDEWVFRGEEARSVERTRPILTLDLFALYTEVVDQVSLGIGGEGLRLNNHDFTDIVWPK
jgi:hypothetical protein